VYQIKRSTLKYRRVCANILCGLVVLTIGCSRSDVESLSVIGDDNIDLGKLTAGEETFHEFRLCNTTVYPILIDSVQTSCSCVVAEAASRRLKSSESVSIPIRFTASSTNETYSASIRVRYRLQNGPSTEIKELTLRAKASIIQDISYFPREIDFGDVSLRDDKQFLRHVEFKPFNDSIRIASVDSSTPVFVPFLESDGELMRIGVKFVPHMALSHGPFAGHILVASSSAQKPRFLIPIKANVIRPVLVNPPTILVSSATEGKVDKTIIITSDEPSRLIIKHGNEDFVVVKILTSSASTSHEVLISVLDLSRENIDVCLGFTATFPSVEKGISEEFHFQVPVFRFKSLTQRFSSK
jgi:hypothetical protein